MINKNSINKKDKRNEMSNENRIIQATLYGKTYIHTSPPLSDCSIFGIILPLRILTKASAHSVALFDFIGATYPYFDK